MNRRNLAATGALLVAVLIALYFGIRHKQELSAPAEPPVEPMPIVSVGPTLAPAPTQTDSAATGTASAPVAQASSAPVPQTGGPISPPQLDTVREQVKRDPHSTPPALLEFANQLAARMETALKSSDPAVARKLFEELSQCATQGNGGVTSAEAMCLSNAARLPAAHPELKTDLQALRDRANPTVLKLVDAADKLAR